MKELASENGFSVSGKSDSMSYPSATLTNAPLSLIPRLEPELALGLTGFIPNRLKIGANRA